MPLEEEVVLDISAALAQVDALGESITAAAANADAIGTALVDAFDSAKSSAADLASTVESDLTDAGAAGGAGITDALAAVDANVTAEVNVDTTSLDDAIATVESADPTLNVDDSQVTDATATVEGLVTAEHEAEDTVITIEADASQVDDATTSIDGLGEASAGAAPAATGLGTSLEGAGAGAGVLAAGLSKVTEGARGLAPGFGVAAVAGGAFGAVLAGTIENTINADEANRRFERTLGDNVSAVTDLSGVVPGLSGSLADLTLRTGSGQAGIKNFAATFQQVGEGAGVAQASINEASKQIIVLANYVAATNPKLGTADEIIGKLSGALARGGRFALNYGLSVGSAADIAAAASEKFGKPAAQLTQVEKIAAGAGLAIEQMGGKIAAGIDKATDDPIVKLRSIETALKRVIVAGETPLIGPLTSSLEDLAPIAESAARAFGSLAQGVIPVFAVELKAVGAALSVVADILDNRVVQALVTGGGAYLAATRSATLFLGAVEKVGPALASLAAQLNPARVVEHISAVTEAAAAQKALRTATVESVDAQEALQTAIATSTATTTEATDVEAAFALVQEKQVAAAAANVAAAEADVAVKDAQAAAADGAVLSQEGLSAAMEKEATLSAAAAVANEEYAAALALQAEAAATAAASEDVETAALGRKAEAATLAATTEIEAAAATEGAAVAVGGLSAVVAPLGIAIAVAAGAWALFGHKSQESQKAVDDAADSLTKYRDELGLTNDQLSSLDTTVAQHQFQSASKSADEFFSKLDEAAQHKFNASGLDLADVGAGLDGSTKAAERFRQSIAETGGLLADTNPRTRAATENWIKYGSAAKDAGEIIDSIDSGPLRDIAHQFDDQSAAAQKARDQLDEKAKAEIKAGNATDVGAVATLAAIGGLGDLSEKNEAAARSLLAKADAQNASADADRASSVAAQQNVSSLSNQLDAVARLQAQIAQGGGQDGAAPLDTSDITAARALAASDAYKSLDKDTKQAVDSTLEFANAQRDAAAEGGHLVDANGEVTKSLVDLNSELDKAISQFDALSARQGNEDAAARAARGSLDDVAKSVKQYGTNLDDTKASSVEAADKARSLADSLSRDAGNIRQFAETELKNGSINAKQFADQLAFMGQAFVENGVKAGIPRDQMEKLAAAQGLLKPNIDLNVQASGLAEAAQNQQALNDLISKLPPEEQVKINMAGDAQKQLQAINEAIDKLPPDQQILFRAALENASAGATKEGLNGVATNDGKGYKAEIPTVATDTEKTTGDITHVADNAGSGYKADINVHDRGTAESRDHIAQVADHNYQATIGVRADLTQFDAQFNAAVARVRQTVDLSLLGHPATGGAVTAAGTIPSFAGGGVFDVSDTDLNAFRRRLDAGQTNPRSGKYPAGQGLAVAAEQGTARGEWILSRDPTIKAQNEQVLGMAAADFGFDLVPRGQMAPVIVNVAGGRTDNSDVVKALGVLGRVLEANLRRDTVGTMLQVGEVIIPAAEVGDGAGELLDAIAGRVP